VIKKLLIAAAAALLLVGCSSEPDVVPPERQGLDIIDCDVAEEQFGVKDCKQLMPTFDIPDGFETYEIPQ